MKIVQKSSIEIFEELLKDYTINEIAYIIKVSYEELLEYYKENNTDKKITKKLRILYAYLN